ncbi:Hepatocellular carcinoma-associated antigen 59 domain containing protein [Rhypophila decipiens]
MTSPEPETAPAAEPRVLFKKRKAYRQRPQERADISNNTTDTNPVAASPAPPEAATSAPRPVENDDDDDEDGLSVAEVIRRRNARKPKLGGVGFHARTLAATSNDASASVADENMEQGMVLHDAEAALKSQQEAEMMGGISSRFAPQTGLVGELVNKNMEEYIESELARRKRLAAAAAAQQQQQQQDGHNSDGSQVGSGIPLKFDPTLPASGAPVESQRVLQGRLMEIDLGEEARARTAAMTERAKRRLQGEDVLDEEEHDSQSKKVRLGPDGKPWRSRNRRGSDAIKRDQLVEEFLSENKLDVSYITAEQAGYLQEGEGEDEEVAADDRIADEFRRQFMDAMSQRHRRRKPAINAKPAVKQTNEEILRGPKLGGSRNARAAMRDKLLREQEMKKKR